MSDEIKWYDSTTYSRDDRERKPTSHTIKHGLLKITVTCGHIRYRPDWVLHCYALGIDTQLLAPGGPGKATPEQAQAQALEHVEARLDELRSDMIKIKRAVNNVPRGCEICAENGKQPCIGCGAEQ